MATLLLLTSGLSRGATYPKYEVRAVWLTTIGGLDWPHHYARCTADIRRQQLELCQILDQLKAAGVNTILLQTRIRGTVIYPSSIEPWDGCLSGVPGNSPGYDALQYAIDECHRRGLEIHAWVVTMPIGKWNAYGCRRLRSRYPSMTKRIGEEGYMNPESPLTASYLADICEEIVRDYDIDGIHLDYIRYPETWNLRISQSEARRHITRIVEQIQERVKLHKPWVKMSCSPIGKYDDLSRYRSYGWNAYGKGCQEAQEWLRRGLMDELFPMMYFRGDQFFPFAFDWMENSYGRIVVPGLGIYMLSPKEKNWNIEVIERELNVLRQLGMGHAYFRSRFLTNDTKGVYQLACRFDTHPAMIPPMIWASSIEPTAPTYLRVERTTQGDNLTWAGATDRSDGSYLLYNVYASPVWPVDVNDAANLIATRHLSTTLAIRRAAHKAPLYYAVTAVDRYGLESEPIQCEMNKLPNTIKSTTLIANDGHTLSIPLQADIQDAEYLAITTLQGNIIYTQPRRTTIDISQLPEGMYAIETLNRRGITHRQGFFIIRRTSHKKTDSYGANYTGH